MTFIKLNKKYKNNQMLKKILMIWKYAFNKIGIKLIHGLEHTEIDPYDCVIAIISNEMDIKLDNKDVSCCYRLDRKKRKEETCFGTIRTSVAERYGIL